MRSYDPTEINQLPKDFRTLLDGYLQPSFSDMGQSGMLAFFSIQNMVNHPAIQTEIIGTLGYETKLIEMTLHIDGLPIFASSRNHFWPVLGGINGVIFIIAFHCGTDKPADSDSLLLETILEVQHFTNHGITVGSHTYKFKLAMMSADTPARAYALKINGHSGYSCCHKCKVKGTFDNNMCFPQTPPNVHLKNSDYTKMVSFRRVQPILKDCQSLILSQMFPMITCIQSVWVSPKS